MKAYTDINQSKKLAEILPLESADVCWTNHRFGSLLSSWRIESTPPQEYKSLLDEFVVRGYLIEPAWSLAAMLKILKDYQLFSNGLIVYIDNESYRIAANPVDACYEMILKLHKQKLL